MRQFSDPSLPAREGVTPLAEVSCCGGQVLIGLREWSPCVVVPPTVIDETRIEFTVRGGYDEECDGQRRVGRAGRCHYRPPGRRVHGLVSSEGLVELVVSFAPSAGGGPDLHGHPAMVTLATGILSELLRGGARASQLEALAARCLSVVHHTRALHGAPLPWIDSVLDRLQDTRSESPTLAELSALAGVHRSHLSRAFRREAGTTPGRYRRLVILQDAATRLASTDQPIAGIAHACGFADQSHLGRHFRCAFGLSPGQFRALLNETASSTQELGRTQGRGGQARDPRCGPENDPR